MSSLPRQIASKGYATINQPLVKKREAFKKSLPEYKLEAKHTQGGVLLPSRRALLELMPKDSVVAEIGVANGDFSEEILELAAPKTLHLVDCWDSERYQSGKTTVDRKFQEQIESEQVRINRGLSVDVLKTFENDYFDWVYIDTDHSYKTTALELLEGERVVKPGGRILGHDFCTGNVVKPLVYGVIQAVNEFCVRNNWGYEYVTLESDGHFSFCIKRL